MSPHALAAGDPGSDSDDDRVKLVPNAPPSKPRKITEKKRADYAVFHAWVNENKLQLSRSTKSKPGLSKKDKAAGGDTLNQDPDPEPALVGTKVIQSPREYQIELFERAKQRNTIAVLDTGTGKTLIAILLIRHIIEKELEARSQGKEKRLTFFLVDKITLVWQQTRQLNANLDFPVRGIHGNTVNHLWASKDCWTEISQSQMVVVCTPEILYNCLHRSYITMRQVNLLVFDEAHHAKKNHTYARIIRDFYVVERAENRPRIFGMTASPLDAKSTNLERAASDLERLLHSEIATIADDDLLRVIGSRAIEKNIAYDRLMPQQPTTLCIGLQQLVGRHALFKKTFVTAKFCVTELGPWCADKLWHIFFRGDDEMSLERRAEGSVTRAACGWTDEISDHLTGVRAANTLLKQTPIGPPDDHLLSSKVRGLVEILQDSYNTAAAAGSAVQCIVFVQRRDVAILLTHLFRQPEMHARIPSMSAEFLIGAGGGGDGLAPISNRQQAITVSKFRNGEINCLFATSIAEEGLDIPGCNVVIRFDLNDTTIQYIQSRGRARMADSVFIQMTEMGNHDHVRRWFQHKANERMMRRFCLSLPEGRVITKADADDVLRGDQSQKVHVIESTGARLTFKQSLVVLAEFVATLPSNYDAVLSVDYTIVPMMGGFQGEVHLPAASPLRSAIGGVYRSKQVAKCAAAYEMCLLLIRDGYLNSHLKSVLTKALPAMRNARLAVSSKKKLAYTMRTKPDMWSNTGTVSELYVTALVLKNPDAMYEKSRPLLLLTRSSLPKIAPFPLFFGQGKSRRSEVRCIPLAHSFRPTADHTDGLCKFTLRVFWDAFSKGFEADATQMPYFLAPSSVSDHAFDFSQVRDISALVDWNVVERVKSSDVVPYNFDEADDFFEDKYITDPFDGSRKFFLRRVRRDMKPQDMVPEGVPDPRPRWRRQVGGEATILNYSISLWAKSRANRTFRQDQAVAEAVIAPLRRNLLDEAEAGKSTEPQTCFLTLEVLSVSQLPVDTVAMAYNFPAIIYRLENNLIALDGCKVVDLDIPVDLALVAMTKDSDNSEEHDQEPINFQGGMGQNYERLEFLGDCFLKMATSIALYTKIEGDEFEYHVERMVDICNKNLFNWAVDRNLQEYIRSKSFNRRTWYPPGLTQLKGKKTDTDTEHSLADKSVADVCEALIGAAYLTARSQPTPNFDLAVKAVTVLTRSKNHTMLKYDDYYAAYKSPDWETAPPTQTQLELVRKVKDKMGYEFRHPRLLRCAFMHASYPRLYENVPSYQRLEFLGDALLDMVCVDYVFARYPDKDPQWLTEHKMAMVSNQFFGCLAVELGFHRHLVHMHPQLQGQITEWVALADEKRRAAEDDAAARGLDRREYARDFWVEVRHPPKCLPDMVEAYVGALFVDSGYDYAAVEAFFARHIAPYFADMAVYDMYSAKHPVTHLLNALTTGMGCSAHRLVVAEVPDDIEGEGLVTGATKVVAAVVVHGSVRCHATAASGRYAKLAAAKRGIAMFADMDPAEYRLRVGCDCHGEPVEEEEEETVEPDEEGEGHDDVA